MKTCRNFKDGYCKAFYKGENSVVRFEMIFFCKGYSDKCDLYEKPLPCQRCNGKGAFRQAEFGWDTCPDCKGTGKKE